MFSFMKQPEAASLKHLVGVKCLFQMNLKIIQFFQQTLNDLSSVLLELILSKLSTTKSWHIVLSI